MQPMIITYLIIDAIWRILFKSANENILLRLDSFEKPYKQLELVSHRDIQYPGETLALVVHILHITYITYYILH